ncbi:MAG: aminodeoxychorismate synthase component I [Gammaproteobacteria bacterium]|nr:aminodeoxychorismate synthase component I [Gammaproteobacteria bacterium]
MLTELEYRPDTTQAVRSLLDWPYCVFLDSGRGSAFAGRYDIVAARPYATLTTRGTETEVRSRGRIEISCRDPLDLLREQLGSAARNETGLPFAGGAIGYFAYDLGRRFERFDGDAERDIELPEMQIGLYDWALVVDHAERRSFVVSAGRDPATSERWNEILERLGAPNPKPRPVFEVTSRVRSNFDLGTYGDAFARVQDHIRRGDCYQVNLAQRFEASVRGDSWNAFEALRQLSPAPFSAYLSSPHGDVLCSSPERFLEVDGDVVETKPIKGTRPRGRDAALDRALAHELATSMKDRAENVMIVDLLRNDLGKVCVAGSVKVSKLFEIESFAHVHHLVSTVTGRLAPDRDVLDLIRGCFPGGSITGAPKVRAMQIIDSIEPQRRSVYCGSIGYIGFDRRMDTNIAIRTLVRCGDSIYAWAGGGIVADSDVESEFQESLDKAAGLLGVLANSSISAAS